MSAAPPSPVDVGRALEAIFRGAPACDLEGQCLDFKEHKRPAANDRDPLRAGALDLAEACACLANAQGGAVVVGVADEPGGPAAFVGLPDGLDVDRLRRRIWEVTAPNLVVAASRRAFHGHEVIVLTVEPGFDLHRVGGKLRERMADSCAPMTPERESLVRDERRSYDWSGQATPLTTGAVSATALEEARRLLNGAGDSQSRRRARLTDEDLLRECGVLDDAGLLLRAGALLFTSEPIATDGSLQLLRRRAPSGPLIRPPDVHGQPLLLAISACLREIGSVNQTTPVTLESGVQQQLETIPGAAIREAVVNAVAHRDYRVPERVVVEHSLTQLVVTSPGDLVLGVTEQNLLTHTSKPRNAALAEALRVLRLAERAGTGVDAMVRDMVRAGHAPPIFTSGQGQVRVVLNGGAPVARIAALIADLPDDLGDETDVFLVIHQLRTHVTVDAGSIAPVLQKTTEEAGEVLRRLGDDAYDLVEPTRETRRNRYPSYRFRERVRVRLGTVLTYHRNEQDEVEQRIVVHLREYGTISNQTVQNLCQVQINRASVILRSLVDRQVVQKVAGGAQRGRGVRYEPGPSFPGPRARGGRPGPAATS